MEEAHMARVAMLTLCLVLSGSWSGDASAADMGAEQSEAQQPGTRGVSIHYQKGIIEAEISDAPLGQVARELEARTQTRVILTDPESAGWRISAFVKAKSFGEGIRQILNGYSYVIYPVGAETPVIVVLSTRRNLPTPAAIPVAYGPAHGPAPSAVPQEEIEAQAESDAELEAEALAAEEDHDADAVASLAEEQQQNEVLLTKALAMLRSNDRQLHAQAIDQLVGINDPRATQALIRAANGTGADLRSRLQAVESLWNHAADLGFSDQASVNALRQLATDRNTDVRNIARRALVDMQRQQETLIQAMQK
jgi:hypothetical protein